MAQDVTSSDTASRAATVEAEPARPFGGLGAPSRAERARNDGYRLRFVLVYFLLAIVAGAAVGAFAVILSRPSATKAPRAGAAVPSAGGELGVMELATNVARNYRLETGAEFVDVVASRNTVQNGLNTLRVRFQLIQPSDALQTGDSRIMSPTNAFQYSLCGAANECAVPGGASALNGAFLSREALELAIRTFQGNKSVDNVVTFLRPLPVPQGKTAEGFVLMFDRRSIMRDDPALIARDISATLPGAGSTLTPSGINTAEIQRIEELIRPYLFLYRYQLIGGHDAVMQLEPPTG